MKLRIKEDIDNLKSEYGVLFTSDNLNGENALAVFYNNREEAFDFYNDAEVMGKDVFNKWDPDIMTKKNGFEPDFKGRCYYHAYTSDGEEYLQEVKVVNTEPLYL